MSALLLPLLLSSSALLAESLSLRESVTVDNIFEHLKRFDAIAAIGNRNSRSVRNNYNASAEYVIEQLSPYCTVTTQSLVVPVHAELEQPTLALAEPYQTPFQYGVDFIGMRYGGDGFHNFSAEVTEVKVGCTADAFSDFPTGNIALIQEGGCELVDKAILAEDNGASAILFYNIQSRTALLTTRVRFVDWKEGDRLVKKPVFALSNVMGKLLIQLGIPVVSLTANMRLTLDPTYNVFCDSRSGSKSDVVMAGAHLDSVPEGPGLNDNASGSATLLEIALQFFKLGINNQNAVRFAWWGAEEIGLLGSRHYVRNLLQNDPEGRNNLALYMNFDMLAAPNFIPYVHDGYQVNDNIPEPVKAASRQIQILFEDYFKEVQAPYQLNGMTGGSDFLPFLEGGFPSSGMATGASGIKTAPERETFGGLADALMTLLTTGLLIPSSMSAVKVFSSALKPPHK